MTLDRSQRNRRSAVWAAYGDALGFMTELADADRVQFRIGTSEALDTVQWKRKVGGYSGTSIVLPAGAYSDDTQLRLATCRSIRSDGSFDVAAFAKVEITSWANYALGAGIGSKEAASNLSKTSATWYSNFFSSKKANYFKSGGNGAAMRVQPHAWATKDVRDYKSVLIDVIKNTICTHGHPVGIVGACLHAITLLYAMREGRPATLQEVRVLLDNLRVIPALVDTDGDLRLLWLGAWESGAEALFEEAINAAIDEAQDDLALLHDCRAALSLQAYLNAVQSIGGLEPSTRGSAIKTALLASFVCAMMDRDDPKYAIAIVANALGSDTDSIATMAGAILGYCSAQECTSAIQDRDYIEKEADRLSKISIKEAGESFKYPDIRSWKPAKTALDAIGLLNEVPTLNGIGEISAISSEIASIGSGETLQWYRLPFGQTILGRARADLRVIKPAGQSVAPKAGSERRNEGAPPPRLNDLFAGDEKAGHTGTSNDSRTKQSSLSQQLQDVITSGFSPDVVGKALLSQVKPGESEFIEKGISLASMILTAYEARKRRGN